MIKLNLQNPLEHFGTKVFNLLVENFSETFFVGGFVRDKLLHRKTQDIDIATRARPEQIIRLLEQQGISFDSSGKNFGSVRALHKASFVEITSFRQEAYQGSRYPKISYAASIKDDAQRRDFTINALYFNPKTGQFIDFFKGAGDLKRKRMRFIGSPELKIKQDPLRILRGLRFCLSLDFKMNRSSWLATLQNFMLVNRLTKNKIRAEISKIKNARQKKLLEKIVTGEKALDKLTETFYDNFK